MELSFLIVWFETSLNSDVYLEKVLKNSIWHAVKAVATRLQYCFSRIVPAVSSVPEFQVWCRNDFLLPLYYYLDLSPPDSSFSDQAMAHLSNRNCASSAPTGRDYIVEILTI